MNAVEIESALSELAAQPFDRDEFPFSFLAAFGNKETTLKRLRKGDSNASDVPGAVLQRNHIHLAATEPGEVNHTLVALRRSASTTQAKAKYVLATDGISFEAEELATGESVACEYARFPDYFGLFLPLAGISTIAEIKDNPVDVRATGRLNKLYIELLRENPDWARAERRAAMNHFMARLIFCFFAEDTDIFAGSGLFTRTVDQMTERDGSNVHDVLATLFRAMNLAPDGRAAVGLPRWADAFPYVNGGLFSGDPEAPRFTRTARAYLFQAGQLNWRAINPDIFGSMIQAVADDEERSALGMHYTSVPNILKVLNPLFLDDLRSQLASAADNRTKLLNLRKRLSRIRVFDPACGSGNFLVIAYKQMREIEAVINQRRGEPERRTDIPLTNFRGIELRDFPAEIARLALIIAEFQCDVLYRGQQEALKDVVPLDSQNWIICGNALRLDWLSVCPPTGKAVQLTSDDLFGTPVEQAEIEFSNEGGETYICGNPPYKGSQDQTDDQKRDLAAAFGGRLASVKSADYVAGWFILARDFIARTSASAAFVSTNSIHQGRQVSLYWPAFLGDDLEIFFAWPSFKWSNLASQKAMVTVSIIGLRKTTNAVKRIFEGDTVTEARFIGPYLVPEQNVIVSPAATPISDLSEMSFGSMPNDGGGLILTSDEARELVMAHPDSSQFIRRLLGSHDAIQGGTRYCLWISEEDAPAALAIPQIRSRVDQVKSHRQRSRRDSTRRLARTPYLFGEVRHSLGRSLVLPRVSSADRPYLPFDIVDGATTVVGDSAILMPAFMTHELALVASRMHLAWIATVCGKLKTDFRYSSTLGWNTFPVPPLTDQNRADLTRCAVDLLLVRESHFPATIAELYDVDTMPSDLRSAHERVDEVVERIYIGRRFRNDTERLEKLFALYAKLSVRLPRSASRKKAPK